MAEEYTTLTETTSAEVSPFTPIEVEPYDNTEGYDESLISGVEAPTLSDETSVEARIGSLLDSNSDLMRRAQSFGEAQASKMGALGSTGGIRAAQSSLYDVAESIATKDAGTAAAFEQLGFNYDAMLGEMNEQQRLNFETMDKQQGISNQLLNQTQDFQRWSKERGWSEDLTSDMMTMFTSLGKTALSSMASMAGSSEVTGAEATDFQQAWQDTIESLGSISTLDLTLEV